MLVLKRSVLGAFLKISSLRQPLRKQFNMLYLTFVCAMCGMKSVAKRKSQAFGFFMCFVYSQVNEANLMYSLLERGSSQKREASGRKNVLTTLNI